MNKRFCAPNRKLNELQVSLLRLFDRGMTNEQILELKRVLVSHYSTLLSNEARRTSQKKGYTEADFNAILNSPS